MQKLIFHKSTLFFLFFLFFLALHNQLLAEEAKSYDLQLTDEKGKILYSKNVNENFEFAIRFIHSVAKSPVTDHFIIKDGKIFLDKTIYHDFGAGLPHYPEKGQKMKAEHGSISITGFNREIPELALRVGRVAEHSLLLFGENEDKNAQKAINEIPLASLAKPGSVIMFKVIDLKK